MKKIFFTFGMIFLCFIGLSLANVAYAVCGCGASSCSRCYDMYEDDCIRECCCGDYYREHHNYSDATCINKKECYNCGRRTGSVDPNNHKNYRSATCLEDGKCYDCGEIFPALGHNYIGCCTKQFEIGVEEGYRLINVLVNGISQGPITTYTFSELTADSTIEVITEKITYEVTFNANGGIGYMESQTFEYGTEQKLSASTFSKQGFAFEGWSTSPTGSVEYTNEESLILTGNKTLYAVWGKPWAGWNAPLLGTGMTPVNWNGSSWADTTEAEWDYNYETATAGHGTVAGDGTGKWANARTADGSMYVWIPRYSYKIESGYHKDVDSWSSVDTPGTGKILVKFSKGTVDEVTAGAANASEGYIAHPAFTFGTDQLKGIWVAKYEASRNDATIDSVGTGTTVTSKPGVKSWISTTVSDMYNYAYNLNRDLDSHLMKNSEWGAVAYLTNAIGKIPYINNYKASSSPYPVTGYAGASQDQASVTGNANSYAWNDESGNGVKASTTHNVYGIFDLSGGAYEYVSAYLDNGNSSLSSYASNLVSNKGTKYVDVYPVGTSDSIANNYAAWSNIRGDAVYETSSGASGTYSWDGDYSSAPYSSNPVFQRGGYCGNASFAGVFCFYYLNGNSNSNRGFRAVLAIP